MRIVGGEKRSRLLTAPPGNDTRPTADKVREALYNILGPSVLDAAVLDLYAGSGALSLEALSRGASRACLVDKDRKAAAAIQKNIAALGYEDRARFLPLSDTEAIARLSREGEAFDLILLDPPYRMDTAPVLAKLMEAGLVKPTSLIVVEHADRTPPVPDARLYLTDRRRYGITGLSFFRPAAVLEGNQLE